ncbi:MAG TPA: phosphatidylglycerol lysyltransferase domain-containing protein [Baekduia sp.]|uniref:phosphatidylglycerol lysyltransferase domain-containing protein n=1 Tax=Baekduia sp. TaxID=2600305 RepID=UPI002B51961F|nr:phosphatidylglycerol lysyltransferase domain-containing protein [Baekduia sp.]HMJ32907.1 phosphatidylglycerol lysyltransferase domain-containing protein [Baekduia sp.]
MFPSPRLPGLLRIERRRPPGPRLHVPPARGRVPMIAGLATAAVGALNVLSALTEELPLRLRDLVATVPVGEVRLAHALALPTGMALVGAARPLAKRRRRALHGAVALLAGVGVLNVLKGLDIEEAVISWALAGVLWRCRAAFWVGHQRPASAALAARVTLLVLGPLAVAVAAVAMAAGHAVVPLTGAAIPRAAIQLLTVTAGPDFRGGFGWLPIGLGVLGVGAAIAIAATILEPLRPVNLASAVDRRRAAALVRRHGTDTLSAFKLRCDLHRLWSADGRAMVAYRIEAGSMLLAGDPTGPPDALPAMVDEAIAWAHRHGLGFGAVGASEQFAATARAAGVRRLYLGDEALLSTGTMDLSGGSRKTMRKAVNRVARNGYTAELRTVAELDAPTVAQLHAVSDAWRDGTPERGFSMAHDTLVDELLPDAMVLLGRDGDGTVRGFLHFVPVFGRTATSLGFMRRERDTPNGLTEFLVVEAARLLAERGVTEFSLNFAAYGRLLRDPANVAERALAVVLRRADRYFQVERLLRFNEKFAPRWQPRYLLFEGPAQLPRIALASMWAEGQLPRLSLPRGAAPANPVPAIF